MAGGCSYGIYLWGRMRPDHTIIKMQIKRRLNTSKPESVFDKNLESELLNYTQELADTVNKGLVLPQMTGTQRDAIVNPPMGSLIYNTTTLSYNFYNGTIWKEIATA